MVDDIPIIMITIQYNITGAFLFIVLPGSDECTLNADCVDDSHLVFPKYQCHPFTVYIINTMIMVVMMINKVHSRVVLLLPSATYHLGGGLLPPQQALLRQHQSNPMVC